MKIVMRNTDTVTGLFFFCLSLVLLWQTRQFATSMETVRAIGPQVFPNAIAGTMCVLSLLLFAQGMRKPVVSLWVGGGFSRNAGLFTAITLCTASFIFLLQYLGVALWMFCFLVVMQYIIGDRSFKRMFLVAFLVSGMMYGIFVFCLNIVFPKGVIGV